MNSEINLFNYDFPHYKITNKVRLIELFGGIGSQAKALENLGVDFEHYKLVEFDEHCIKSYNAIHNTNFIAQDITKIKGEDLEIKDTYLLTYLLTYSFPCQDLSLAGLQKGMQEGTNTRSSLLWEVKRLLLETSELPQILLMENVPLIHSKKNIKDFNKWLDFLDNLGYKNYYKDLNAKDYGIPQNRNRCFMVSVLGDYLYEFPKKQKLNLKLSDLIETNCDLVDKKYLCSYQIIKCFCTNPESNYPRQEQFINNIFKAKEVANTLTTKHGTSPIDNFVLYNKETKKYLEIRKKTKNYIEFIEKGKIDQDCRICTNNISLAITTKNSVKFITENFLIRRLTPIESFRLMGFSDEDYEKASKVVSETQLYKQCGNSIVVNVLEKIFRQLF